MNANNMNENEEKAGALSNEPTTFDTTTDDCTLKDGVNIPAGNNITGGVDFQVSFANRRIFSPCPDVDISLEERIKLAADFFSSWYEGAGDCYSSLFKVDSATAFPFQCGSKEQIIDALKKFSKYENIKTDAFFHVNVTRNADNSPRRLNTSTVDAQIGIAVDIDFDDAGHKGDTSKNCPDLESARLALSKVPEPSFVIFTGHGCHVYYKFVKPFVFSDEADRAFAKKISEQFTKFFSAQFGFPVDSCHDLTRILRVPYSYNFKGGKKILSYVAYSSNARYTPQDFENILANSAENLFEQSQNAPAEIESVPTVETKISTPTAKGNYVTTGDLTGCAVEILNLLNPSTLCDLGGDTAWLAVMTACKQLGVDYATVDTWNAPDSARYNSKTNKIRWDSIQPNENFGLGTLLGFAEKQGISAPRLRDIKHQFNVEISRADATTFEKNSVETFIENSSSDDPTAAFASISVRQKFLESLIDYALNEQKDSAISFWLYKGYWLLRTDNDIVIDVVVNPLAPFYAVDRMNLGEFICAVYEDIARHIENNLTADLLFSAKSSVAELPSFVEKIAIAYLFEIDPPTLRDVFNSAEKILPPTRYKDWKNLIHTKKFEILRRLNDNVKTFIHDSRKERATDIDQKILKGGTSDVDVAKKFVQFFGKHFRYADALNEFFLYNEELFRRADIDVADKFNGGGVLQLFQPRWRKLSNQRNYVHLLPYFNSFVQMVCQYCTQKLAENAADFSRWLSDFFDAHKKKIISLYKKNAVPIAPLDYDELTEDIESAAKKNLLKTSVADINEIIRQYYGNFLSATDDRILKQIEDFASIYGGYLAFWVSLKATKKIKDVLPQSVAYSTLLKESVIDGTPSLIGCLNGIVDLKTGKLLDYDSVPAHSCIVTKRVNAIYMPNFRADSVENFFLTTFPDEETRDAAKRWLGYLLTGEIAEHKALFLDGTGSNGKTTLLTILADVLNFYADGYATRLPSNVLLKTTFQRDPNSPSPEIEKLRGRRLAIIDEMTGAPIDESFFKSLVGGDVLEGRGLHKSPVSFKPTHKLVIAGNTVPAMSLNLDVTYSDFVSDNPIGRRIVILPFKQKFAGDSRNVNLLNELTTPAARCGLFSMMVDEARAWYDGYTHGTQRLKHSAEMEDALHAYYEKCISVAAEKSPSQEEVQSPALLDDIIDFVNEHCTISGNSKDKVSFKEFKARFEANAMFGSDEKVFSRALRRYVEKIPNLQIVRYGDGNVLKGMRFNRT